jgi:hypothetical protein
MMREAIASVLIHVDETGQAKVVRVMTSSSYRFADVTKSAAVNWKFKPGMRDGKRWAMLIEYILFFDREKDVKIAGPLYE